MMKPVPGVIRRSEPIPSLKNNLPHASNFSAWTKTDFVERPQGSTLASAEEKIKMLPVVDRTDLGTPENLSRAWVKRSSGRGG